MSRYDGFVPPGERADALGPVEGRLAVHEQLLSWLAEAAIEDRERRLDLEPRRDGTLLSAYGDCAPHELDQLLDRLWGVVAGRSLKLLQSPRPAAGITVVHMTDDRLIEHDDD